MMLWTQSLSEKIECMLQDAAGTMMMSPQFSRSIRLDQAKKEVAVSLRMCQGPLVFGTYILFLLESIVFLTKDLNYYFFYLYSL